MRDVRWHDERLTHYQSTAVWAIDGLGVDPDGGAVFCGRCNQVALLPTAEVRSAVIEARSSRSSYCEAVVRLFKF